MRVKYSTFILLLFCCASQALELGEPRVESRLGETLDMSIPLVGIGGVDRGALRLVRADRGAYAKAGVGYKPLHERVVMELVLDASQPRVAVSSIGPVHEKAFRLVVGIGGAGGTWFQPVRVVLNAPPPPAVRVMAPPGVLARLLSLLAEEQGRSRTGVFAEFRRIADERPYQTGEQRPVMRFARDDFDPAFVGGVESLLDDDASATFRRLVREGRSAHALSEVLFGDGRHAVLKKLLAAGTVSAMREGESASQRLRRLDDKVAALENRIVELGYLLERGAGGPQEAARARWWERVFRLLEDYGWHNRRLLSRPLWIGFAAFGGLLLLLLVWRQWRRVRAAAAARTEAAGAQPPVTPAPGVLPGQRELEHARAGGGADTAAGQLHLAYAYLEMGESKKASKLLDEVIRNGNAEQVGRARSLQGKLG